tara:strand:- start:1017 stop:1226 length:210 start_codon:yes stop_codon:yes gene_type:complete
MIGDLDVSGVLLPTLLVMMTVAYLLYLPLHALLTRLNFYRLVWHRALFNVALYALLVGMVDAISRSLMS